MSTIDDNSLTIFSGTICCYSLLYTDFPALVGCSGEGEFLCVEEKFCLKMGAEQFPIACGQPAGYICQLSLPCLQYALKMPVTCIKGSSQMCCCVNKAALPTDADVPAVCAICFVTLFPAFGVMKKLGEIKG